MNMFRIVCMCNDILDFVKNDYFETENIYIKSRNSSTFDISIKAGRRRIRVIENNVPIIQGGETNRLEEYIGSIVKVLNIKLEPTVLEPVDVALSKLKKIPDELFLEFKMKYSSPPDSDFSCLYLIPVKTNEVCYTGFEYDGEYHYLICGTTFQMYYIEDKENKFILYRGYNPYNIFKIIERGYL